MEKSGTEEGLLTVAKFMYLLYTISIIFNPSASMQFLCK
jgi:hypothetical protein